MTWIFLDATVPYDKGIYKYLLFLPALESDEANKTIW